MKKKDTKNLKFEIVTLGCRTNQYESQGYKDQLLALGHTPVQEGEKADLCIVNTCTVTASADSTSRHHIRQLARRHEGSRLVVTGCLAEREKKSLLQIGGVTDLIPNAEKEKLLEHLWPEEPWPEFSIQQFEAHTRAFVKVQDGCNSFCSYCIIPYVRGRSRSRPLLDIVKEVEGLVARGYKEVVLTGINIGDFDGGKVRPETPDRLADLVRAVDAIEGLLRLRISSIDPDEVDDDLLEAVIGGKTTCPSMHVVLQAGSNAVLKRMNRKYTAEMFLETVERLKKARPDFTFTTDVIVGFPGETDEDFAKTCELLRTVQFAKVHMFPYSERPGTRAAKFPEKVPPQEIQRRKQEVLRIAEEAAFALREPYVGKTVEVLTEGVDPVLQMTTGHTANFLTVLLQGPPVLANTLVSVQLLENTPAGLLGVPLPITS